MPKHPSVLLHSYVYCYNVALCKLNGTDSLVECSISGRYTKSATMSSLESTCVVSVTVTFAGVC